MNPLLALLLFSRPADVSSVYNVTRQANLFLLADAGSTSVRPSASGTRTLALFALSFGLARLLARSDSD